MSERGKQHSGVCDGFGPHFSCQACYEASRSRADSEFGPVSEAELDGAKVSRPDGGWPIWVDKARAAKRVGVTTNSLAHRLAELVQRGGTSRKAAFEKVRGFQEAVERDATAVDRDRLLAWIHESPRRPAAAAFTEGMERQIAYWIEVATPKGPTEGPTWRAMRGAEWGIAVLLAEVDRLRAQADILERTKNE